jgi:Tfp pilus assembly protein FimT
MKCQHLEQHAQDLQAQLAQDKHAASQQQVCCSRRSCPSPSRIHSLGNLDFA